VPAKLEFLEEWKNYLPKNQICKVMHIAILFSGGIIKEP
jgi:hypothetical protein